MDILLPQAYLIGLILLLGGAAVVIALQVMRVRRDEAALARLEGQAKGGDGKDPAVLYELGSVQLRKRLYAQAVDTLRLAQKKSGGEPPEAQALIQNALGFSLAAQSNYASAIRHYKAALQAKPDYPVALNNLGYAFERQGKPDEARDTYAKALSLDPTNKTTLKRLKLLDRRFPAELKAPATSGQGMAAGTGEPGSSSAGSTSTGSKSSPKPSPTNTPV
jgi:tetratricopeptide (TPR) repeat protein